MIPVQSRWQQNEARHTTDQLVQHIAPRLTTTAAHFFEHAQNGSLRTIQFFLNTLSYIWGSLNSWISYSKVFLLLGDLVEVLSSQVCSEKCGFGLMHHVLPHNLLPEWRMPVCLAEECAGHTGLAQPCSCLYYETFPTETTTFALYCSILHFVVFDLRMLFCCITSSIVTQIYLKLELWCSRVSVPTEHSKLCNSTLSRFLFPSALPYLLTITELVTFAMKTHVDSLGLQVDGCSLLLETLSQGTVMRFQLLLGKTAYLL